MALYHVRRRGAALARSRTQDRPLAPLCRLLYGSAHASADRAPLEDLIKQWVYALALGYEDLNDHGRLRHDPLAVLVGKPDPTGQERVRARDRGKALAGKSTLNRPELRLPEATPKETRDKKLLIDPEAVAQVLVELFLEAHATPPQEIVLDLNATDEPLHGH
jgi:hypothetical protein